MSKGTQLAGGATLIALLLGWYAMANLQDGASFAYYQNLEDFQTQYQRDSSVVTGHLRVHGYVAMGSIDRDVPQMRVLFSVQNDPPHAGGEIGELLPVVYGSLETPDLFKDGAEVVVEGQLAKPRAGGPVVFHADKVLAKCPSKFEAKTPQPTTL